jgi:hypothetical protein
MTREDQKRIAEQMLDGIKKRVMNRRALEMMSDVRECAT